jgi:hypothetical protein
MKSISTRLVLSACIILAFQFSAFAQPQPDYTFKNPVHISGSYLQVGSTYKFSDVKPGTDANVTVLATTGGIKLDAIDETWTGFDEAFQPFIYVPPASSGYVEFRIDFLTKSGNPKNMPLVPITCVDVDGVDYGDGALYENDQVEFINGYYDFSMAGGNLLVTNPPGWLNIKNTSAWSYSGVDTAAKDVMASVMNKNVSSVKLRIGAINTSPTGEEVRYRSVYFRFFSYPNSVLLPNRTTLSFSGSPKNGGVELKALLSASHTYDKVIIERGDDPTDLHPIAELPITNLGTGEFPFTYFDKTPGKNNYYRLKLVNSGQNLAELSNILVVKINNSSKVLELKNTMVQIGSPVLQINSPAATEATIRIVDMSGRTLYQTKNKLAEGNNSVYINSSSLIHSYGVVVIETPEERKSFKILLQ